MKKIQTLCGVLALVIAFASCSSGGGGSSDGDGTQTTGGISTKTLNALVGGLYWGAPNELTETSTPHLIITEATQDEINSTFWNCVNSGGAKAVDADYSATVILDKDITGGFVAYLSRNGAHKAKLYIIPKGGNRTITVDTTAHIAFDIRGDITLILGNGITLKGNLHGSEPLVKLNESTEARGKAELIMKEGSAITDNGGGGVQIGDRGIFTMEGGTISGNKSTEKGAGVWVNANTAIFIMKGGVIKNNETSFNFGGGGVGVSPSGQGHFYMESGVIYGSEASAGLANKAPLPGVGEDPAPAALFAGDATSSEYGKYNDAGSWVRTDYLTDSNTTIRVTKGVKQ